MTWLSGDLSGDYFDTHRNPRNYAVRNDVLFLTSHRAPTRSVSTGADYSWHPPPKSSTADQRLTAPLSGDLSGDAPPCPASAWALSGGAR